MIFRKLFWIVLFLICIQTCIQWSVNAHAQDRIQPGPAYKIGVLYPMEPSLAEYTNSWSAAAQRVNQLLEPKIELVELRLPDGTERTEEMFEELAAKNVVAIIAPTLQVELWISSARDKPLQRFPLVDIPATKGDLEQLNGELSARLIEEATLHDQLRKLKFQGALQNALLLPVEHDPFGTIGAEVLTNLLDRENIPFQNRELAANAVACTLQLRQAKFDAPDMTLIVSASSAKAEGIINQARTVIGMTGLIIVLTGDYQPVIFDLAEGDSQDQTAKHSWPIRMEPAHIARLSSDLQLAPSAVPFLGALWAAVVGIDGTETQERAELQSVLAASQLAEDDFFLSEFGPSLLFNLYVVPMFIESWLSVDWNALIAQWMAEWVIVY